MFVRRAVRMFGVARPDAHGIYHSRYPNIVFPNHTLCDMVLEESKAKANKIAYVCAYTEKTVTYGQLGDQTRAFASALTNLRKFKKGQVVSLYLPNCLEYAPALYGAATAGGIVSPMNPVSSAEEITKQMQESKARFLVTNKMLLPHALEAAKSLPLLEEILLTDTDGAGEETTKTLTSYEQLVGQGALKMNPNMMKGLAGLNDDFVLPFSSGTTGMPKGVELTHRNLASNMYQFMEMEKFNADKDVFLAILPFFHIYGLLMFLAAAVKIGVKTVVMPRFDLIKYLEVIEKHKVTYLHVAPPVAVALAKHPIIAKHDLSSVRMVFSGAAPLGASTEIEVAQRLKCQVKQAYGLTELSPMCHMNPMDKIKHGTVGVLGPNCEAMIVNVETGKPVPVGTAGELLIRGPNVMKGYLNRPDATRETIRPDGFMHTGDIAIIDDEGYYSIVDRAKELIKYNGLQVAPAELEALLLTHPDVADAGVVGKPDETHGELPTAFVVLKEGHQASEDSIKEFVAKHAAPYKQLRGGVRFIKQIPKSISGKILRREMKKML